MGLTTLLAQALLVASLAHVAGLICTKGKSAVRKLTPGASAFARASTLLPAI